MAWSGQEEQTGEGVWLAPFSKPHGGLSWYHPLHKELSPSVNDNYGGRGEGTGGGGGAYQTLLCLNKSW